MFYHLLYPLASEIGAFNVFRYITFRTGAATLTALFIAFLVGPPLIRKLASLRMGQPIRAIGPDHHVTVAILKVHEGCRAGLTRLAAGDRQQQRG